MMEAEMKRNILCYASHTARRVRPALQARWRLSPATGRLEMRWETVKVHCQRVKAHAAVASSGRPQAA
jgi:hypothetical protein